MRQAGCRYSARPFRLPCSLPPVPHTARPQRREPPPDGLTAREWEILGLVAQGLTNPEIVQTLVLSHHTVKTHLNRIFTKTGSRDRAAAIRYAQAYGLG